MSKLLELKPGAKLMDLKRARAEVSADIEKLLAESTIPGPRALTDYEQKMLVGHRFDMTELDERIKAAEGKNTLHALLEEQGVGFLVDAGKPDPNPLPERNRLGFAENEHPKAAAFQRNFGTWMRRAAGGLSGLGVLGDVPNIEASNPSGVISVGTGTGLDSVNFAVPTDILPFLRSYLQFAPFERAGASIISTDHMRDINLPIVAAGAPPTQYAEGQGPATNASGSQPFGLSGFTFGAKKYSRQVIASWESLQSTEAPLSPMISDELLSSIANVVTQAATTQLYSALTAPPGVTLGSGVLPPLQVGGTSVQADAYGQVTALRHSLPDGLEAPTNAFMLSRSTLAIIRNTRASTSGVPMFDPDADTILGRPYVVNEFFDSICGAGFITYGNWNRGAYVRRTPIISRILQELYWANNEIGFMATQWTDAHYLAELVGAPQPPTWQPLYFTVLASGSLQ